MANQQNETKETISSNIDIETQGLEIEIVDYSKRAQWLRAAVLGANDGLLSTSSLMMGVGAIREDVKTMIITGIAGLVAGACSMAIGEFVSVYSQYDIEVAQIEREARARVGTAGKDESQSREIHARMNTILDESDSKLAHIKKNNLPSPVKAAIASAAAFAVGAMVPLLAVAFVREYRLRLVVVIVAVTLALVGFGALGAVLGKAPLVKSSTRVLFGGWLAMGITFGITKLVGTYGI